MSTPTAGFWQHWFDYDEREWRVGMRDACGEEIVAHVPEAAADGEAEANARLLSGSVALYVRCGELAELVEELSRLADVEEPMRPVVSEARRLLLSLGVEDLEGEAHLLKGIS